MPWIALALALALLGAMAFTVVFMMRGKLTLDLGWGRTIHSLGPIVMEIEAPQEVVFQSISGPYLGRTPKRMRDYLEVIERGEDFALAAHYTAFRWYTAETVEIVQFDAPDRVSFRHVRGPVPHAVEAFELTEVRDDVTELEYTGEFGIDFWALGSVLARTWVRPTWEAEVSDSLETVKAISERRAEARAERGVRNEGDEPTSSA